MLLHYSLSYTKYANMSMDITTFITNSTHQVYLELIFKVRLEQNIGLKSKKIAYNIIQFTIKLKHWLF